jgi:CHAT domain-containing protein
VQLTGEHEATPKPPGDDDAAPKPPGDDDAAPKPPRVTPMPLPSAEREASNIANLYRAAAIPADTLLGDQIDKDGLRRRCTDLDTAPTVLHLAVHGANVMSDTPLESWLLLPHSRLDGIDLARWRLDGCTVVLSACSAGQRAVGGRRMQELPGDDVFGLQTAFFDAGAQQIVGALWPVDGNAAGPLLRTFHEQMRYGAPADIALQRAVVTFLDTPDLYFNRPRYWAPFYLTSLGRPTALGGAP